MARQHVIGEGVAAHERARVGGAGPDDSHATKDGPPISEQGKCGSRIEEDDCALGHLAGQSPVTRGVEVGVAGCRHRALRRPVPVEEPERRPSE